MSCLCYSIPMMRSGAKTLTGCDGNYVIPVQDPTDGAWGYFECDGCDACSWATRAARLAFRPPAADPFAGLPCDDDFDPKEW